MRRREFLKIGAGAGLLGLTGAQWGEAAPSAQRETTLWLNWNENPLGLSAAVRSAAEQALERAHRYPDRSRAELATLIAERAGLKAENVVLGCGSTQILRAVVAANAALTRLMVLAEPTFEAMVRYERPFDYEIRRVPLDRRHAHDLSRMKAVVADEAALVYLCNPNNPTATLTPSSEIDAWIHEAPERVLFAVDEAYYEYVESPQYWSAAKWVADRPNVVVTRTFSKIYSMAGLRLGYALAEASTARRLREFLSADNANGVAIAAAAASLRSVDLLQTSRRVNAEAKAVALECLDELGLEALPSHANFLMHRVPGDLESYIGRMRDHGIRVGRPFAPKLGFNRLSLGLPAEMDRWAETLRTFRLRGWV